jgi:hypothetical protein
MPEGRTDASAPRFYQALATSAESTLHLRRSELLAEIAAHLAALKHVRRVPSSPGAADDSPETLAAAEPKLQRGDLLTITLLLDFLAQRQGRQEVLQMGAADRTDTTSEHGGRITAKDGQLAFTLMPPMYGGSDTGYVTPDKAMDLVPASIALFHLHFHHLDNAENAGPGGGDLAFAHMNRVSCVVFTSLDAHTFDADYYNPDGAVVDLGVYHDDE